MAGSNSRVRTWVVSPAWVHDITTRPLGRSAARQTMSAYSNMEELIRIGAYRAGADPLIDRAIALNPAIEQFLSQDKDDATSLEASFAGLDDILNGAD